MKYLFILLFVVFHLNCFSIEKECDWLDYYVSAELAIGVKDGKAAIEEFSKAIGLNPDALILYVQRGQVYVKKHEYEKAIEDFTHVIDSPNPHISVLLPALRGRAGCYLILDGDACFLRDMSRTDRFHLDYDRAKSLDAYLDFTKENKRYEITANIPASDIHNQDFREAFIAVRIQLGMCDSPDDIKFFDNGVAITKLKCNCGCQEEPRNLKQDTQCCVGCG